MARRKSPAPDEPESVAAPEPLPDDWRARHPRRTYPDETVRQHAARLRALAAEVPAKRERFLAYAEHLERGG